MENQTQFNTVSIYILCEPETDIVRYVGVTKTTLKNRLSNHIRAAKYRKQNNHRLNWIRSLLQSGLSPDIKVVRIVPEHCWEYYEKFYIEHYRSLGCDLINGCDGGRGSFGYSYTDESRAKIKEARARQDTSGLKGRVVSEETKEKIRAARAKQAPTRLGSSPSQETRDKIADTLRSKKDSLPNMSSEHCRQMILKRWSTDSTTRTWTLSEETKEKMSISKLGKKRGPMSEEQKIKIADSVRSYWLNKGDR